MYAQKCLLGVWPGSFPGGKESACNARNLGSIPGFGKSTREGKGYPLQYSGLENSMDCIVPWGHKESDMTEQVSLHFTGPGDSLKEPHSLVQSEGVRVCSFLPQDIGL